MKYEFFFFNYLEQIFKNKFPKYMDYKFPRESSHADKEVKPGGTVNPQNNFLEKIKGGKNL